MASRKSGSRRPAGGMQISRWASLLFGGLILLFIGILIGMRLEAQRQQVSAMAAAKPQRIVVEQPQRVIGQEPPPAAGQPAARKEAEAKEAPPPVRTAAVPDPLVDRIETAPAATPEPNLPPIPALPPVPAYQPLTQPQQPATVAERVVPAVPPQVTPAALSLPGGAASGWRKHAVAPPRVDGRPMIAVVIDDLGIDRKRSDRIVALPGPLTTAFMSYAKDLPKQTAIARGRGHELMLHLPMEPQGESYDAGPEVLTVGLAPSEIRRRVNDALGRFEGMIGLNNHMGSRFTADRAGMRIVMEELSKRGLMFLDSFTTPRSVGVDEARRHGVTALARDVFIDNEETFEAVTAQLLKAEQVARKQGYAVAIGHPHDATVDALAAWLPTLKDKGLVLVPISTILRRQFPSG